VSLVASKGDRRSEGILDGLPVILAGYLSLISEKSGKTRLLKSVVERKQKGGYLVGKREKGRERNVQTRRSKQGAP